MSSKIKFRIFDSMSKLKSLFKIKNENRERQQELVLRDEGEDFTAGGRSR